MHLSFLRKSHLQKLTGVVLSHNFVESLLAKNHFTNVTEVTTGHLEIIWELFAKRSADILSFHNSFITISSLAPQFQRELAKNHFTNVTEVTAVFSVYRHRVARPHEQCSVLESSNLTRNDQMSCHRAVLTNFLLWYKIG